MNYQILAGSGCVPISSRPYVIRSARGEELTGTTDGDGCLVHEGVAAGDYELEIDSERMIVGSLPKGTPRIPHVFFGFSLGKKD